MANPPLPLEMPLPQGIDGRHFKLAVASNMSTRTRPRVAAQRDRVAAAGRGDYRHAAGLGTGDERRAPWRRRGESLIELELRAVDGGVGVAGDPGRFSPEERDAPLDEPGGWGLVLVDQMAERWGVVRDERTRVWFELATAA